MSEVVKAEQVNSSRVPERTDAVDRWFADWPRPHFWSELRRSISEGMELPKVEEIDEGDHLVVRAELPGMDPDRDVQITVDDHTLHLRAERRQEERSDEKGVVRTEFHYGSVTRTVPLPAGATDKDVKATYKDGILEVRIPMNRDEAQSQRIPIERV